MSAIPRIRAKTPIGILKAVVRLIREEPRRYDQGDYIFQGNPKNGDRTAAGAPLPPCGTVCCVAGWVAVGKREGNRISPYSNAHDQAQEILGLTGDQAWDLFSSEAIPSNLKEGTKAYVKAGVRHIERFMRAELGYTGPKL